MARAMFVLKPLDGEVIEQEVKVVEKVERDVRIEDGDEIVCIVVGKAKRLGDTPEVEIREAKFVRVLEVRKAPH